MPLYSIKCDHCGKEQDVFRSLAKIDDLPDCCGERMHRQVCAPHVVADIAPYQAVAVDVATGKAPVITSRSQHREYLRRNGYIEVGNEMPKPQRKEVHGDFNVRTELREAVREVLPRHAT